MMYSTSGEPWRKTVPLSGHDELLARGLSQARFAMSGQDKHLRDVRSIIRLQPDLDQAMVGAWATRYGVADAWRLAQPSG